MLKKMLILYCLFLIPCLREPQTPVFVKLLMPIPLSAVGAVILAGVGKMARKIGQKLGDKLDIKYRPLTEEERKKLDEDDLMFDPAYSDFLCNIFHDLK